MAKQMYWHHFFGINSIILAYFGGYGVNFYSSNLPEYYWQKPHYNLGNQVVHSDLYKKLNPVRQRYDYQPNEYTQMPFYMGVVPQFYWLYGNLDYSFKKWHRHY